MEIYGVTCNPARLMSAPDCFLRAMMRRRRSIRRRHGRGVSCGTKKRPPRTTRTVVTSRPKRACKRHLHRSQETPMPEILPKEKRHEQMKRRQLVFFRGASVDLWSRAPQRSEQETRRSAMVGSRRKSPRERADRSEQKPAGRTLGETSCPGRTPRCLH